MTRQLFGASEDPKTCGVITHTEKVSSKAESTTSKRSTAGITEQLEQPSSSDSASEPKTSLRMPLRPLTMKPLPSIGGPAPLPAIGSLPLGAALDQKKKQTEEALRRNQDQLTAHRKQEEQLREQITSSVDPAEVERRARHMKERRELLLAKKKAEREEKVRLEEERQSKKHAADQEMLAESLERINAERFRDAKADDKSSPSEEARRASLRNALARRMKMDLLDNEEAKLSQLQDTQFAELDRRLQQVEQLREDNRRRDYILSKQMERQQAQIARNIRISAQELSRDKDAIN